MTHTHFLAHTLLLTSLSLAHSSVWAEGVAIYHFLPSDTVTQQVKTALQDHGIPLDDIEVRANAQGVVTLQGEVASKPQAETATAVAKQAEGVYAVLAELRYSADAAGDLHSQDALPLPNNHAVTDRPQPAQETPQGF